MEAEMGSFLAAGNNELSFFDCFDEKDDVDMMKYMMYCKLEEAEEEKLLFEVFLKTIRWRTHPKILQSEEEARMGKVGKSIQREALFLAKL
eukprot:10368386-Ditylum_brightwellii.AAC.1